MACREEIGILGGSFNPVHAGHLMLASWLAQYTSLRQVWMMLSPANPLKDTTHTVNEQHRLEMLRIAVGKDTVIKACDLELHMPRPSYTIDTLRKLQHLYPQYRFRLIIGSDNWQIFDQWREKDEIIENFSPMIYPRRGYEINTSALPEEVTVAEAPMIEISSTMIRKAIAEGKDINHFLPCGVYNYILSHNLYK